MAKCAEKNIIMIGCTDKYCMISMEYKRLRGNNRSIETAERKREASLFGSLKKKELFKTMSAVKSRVPEPEASDTSRFGFPVQYLVYDVL